jgi:drug/metabolite transporter (DMT)-like permease
MMYLRLLLTAVAHIAYTYTLSRIPASYTVSFLYLIPALAFLVARVRLGEVPSILPVIGGVIALAGVLLVKRRAR